MNNVNSLPELWTTSDRIQKICNKKGWTAEKFVWQIQNMDINISRETARSWYYKNTLPWPNSEKGQKNLNILCTVLECDVDYLLGRIDEPTHELDFIHKYTGLSSDSIRTLHRAEEQSSEDGLFPINYKPLSSAVDFMLTNEHGLRLLQHIYDFINSDRMNLSYQDHPIEGAIHVNNTDTDFSFDILPEEFHNLLLTEIVEELTLMKESEKKEK